MKTLDQHNAERWEAHLEAHQSMLDSQKPHPNGIACPNCGKELWDSNPAITLTSYPAKKNVHCPSCGHSGYRIA